MTHDSPDSAAAEHLLIENFDRVVGLLGGAARVTALARATKAFVRARGIRSAVDLLRLVLAYCLSDKGLRATMAQAAAAGLPDVSNVALFYRLQKSGDWLEALIGHVLAERTSATVEHLPSATPGAIGGRLIRLVDGTTVPKAGKAGKRGKGEANGLWRIHAAYDLPSERFGAFELTEETGGEQLDRIAVVPGEIRIADRAFLQADRMAAVVAAGGDLIVRAGWKGARWLTSEGARFDLVAALKAAEAEGTLEMPVWLGRNQGAPLGARLVAIAKPPEAAAEARDKARREAQRGGHVLSAGTLVAAGWVILVTTLDAEAVPAHGVLALYRLRWRIELAFKRLKSQIGLAAPPGSDPGTAKAWLLAHLLVALLLEPLTGGFEVSPRRPPAALLRAA